MEKDFEQEEKLLRKITDNFGIDTELTKLSEEVGELLNECYRVLYIGGDTKHIEDEMADVHVILAQIFLHFGLDNNNIGKIYEQKIKRTADRIDDGWYDKHR